MENINTKFYFVKAGHNVTGFFILPKFAKNTFLIYSL